MTALLRDLGHYAREHEALTVSLVLLTLVAVLFLVGIESDTWLLAFAGLGVVYLGFALIDLRDEFRRRTD